MKVVLFMFIRQLSEETSCSHGTPPTMKMGSDPYFKKRDMRSPDQVSVNGRDTKVRIQTCIGTLVVVLSQWTLP